MAPEFSLEDDLALAERAAREAGELLLARFGGPVEGLETKSSATDPVSDADREAEAAISALIARERPDDAIVGEEGINEGGTTGRRWVVDPLDGTVNFLFGYPAWAVSVALEDESGPLVGVVADPARGESFRAVRGGGCELNGRPAHVRDPAPLERALVATGFAYDPRRRSEQARLLAVVLPRVRDVRRAGAAALDLAWVAAGRLDGYYERGLNEWDWGAALRELPGEPFGIVAAAPGLLDPLYELVAARANG
ncbi:MAG: inositol monophosphatase family protein [Thermoleophilaceae bacterium]